MIKAILACDESGGVGLNGKMPWPHIPVDFQWFMDQTKGHVMVMGRTTWQDSQLGHPVSDRLSYVVTRNPDVCSEADGVIQGNIIQRILDLQYIHPGKIIWIIGGATLIEATLSIIDEFVLSRIPGTYGCDRFLPLKDLNEWPVVWEEQHPDVTFQRLQKIRPFNGFVSHLDDFHACILAFAGEEAVYEDKCLNTSSLGRIEVDSLEPHAYDAESSHDEYLQWMFIRQHTLERLNVYNSNTVQSGDPEISNVSMWVDYTYDDGAGSYSDIYVQIDDGVTDEYFMVDYGDYPDHWSQLLDELESFRVIELESCEQAYGPTESFGYSFDTDELEPRDKYSQHRYEDRLWVVLVSKFSFLKGHRNRYDALYRGEQAEWKLALSDTLSWIDVFFPLHKGERVVSPQFILVQPTVMAYLQNNHKEADQAKGWSVRWNDLSGYATVDCVDGLLVCERIIDVPKGLFNWSADTSREDQEQYIYNALVSGLSMKPVAFGDSSTYLIVLTLDAEMDLTEMQVSHLIVLESITSLVRLPVSLTHLYARRWESSYLERCDVVEGLPNLIRLEGTFGFLFERYNGSEISGVCAFLRGVRALMDSPHLHKILELLCAKEQDFTQARVLIEGVYPSFLQYFDRWMSWVVDEVNPLHLSDQERYSLIDNWTRYGQSSEKYTIESHYYCDETLTSYPTGGDTHVCLEWCPELQQVFIPESNPVHSLAIKDCRRLTHIEGLDHCSKLLRLQVLGMDFTREYTSEEWRCYTNSSPNGRPKTELDMDWERLHTQIQQLPNIKELVLSQAVVKKLVIPASVEVLELYSVKYEEIQFAPNSKLRVVKSIDSITDLSDFEYLSTLQDCSIRISGDLQLPSRWSNSLRSLSLWANRLSGSDTLPVTPNLRRLHLILVKKQFEMIYPMSSWIRQLNYLSIEMSDTHLVQKGKFIPDSFERLINAIVLTEPETKPLEETT